MVAADLFLVDRYQNSGISTGRNAAQKHASCAITDQHGKPTAYRSCAAGQDMPLFFANGSNSWSTELEAVYGALNYRTAARTLFLRPYLAHFCSFFRRFFAVFSVKTPGIRRVAPEDRGAAA